MMQIFRKQTLQYVFLLMIATPLLEAAGVHPSISAYAHDWQELDTVPPTADELSQAVAVAERLQERALTRSQDDALLPSAANYEPAEGVQVWWLWLGDRIGLGDRENRKVLQEAIVTGGFDHAPGEAIAWWTTVMDRLVATLDAGNEDVTRVTLPKELVDSVAPRVEALVRQAENAR